MRARNDIGDCMEFSGSIRLRTERKAVWAALNDPVVLQACIPGCTRFEPLGNGLHGLEVGVGIGPLRATFDGSVRLVEIDPARVYRLEGEGSGGMAGLAQGTAEVQLVEIEGGTELVYDITAAAEGRIAQFGARMITGTARRFTEQFFDRLAVHLDARWTVAGV